MLLQSVEGKKKYIFDTYQSPDFENNLKHGHFSITPDYNNQLQKFISIKPFAFLTTGSEIFDL